jgi:hypothetical protein
MRLFSAAYAQKCEPRVRGAPYKSVENTVALLLAHIDGATRESAGGQHLGLDVEGDRLPW